MSVDKFKAFIAAIEHQHDAVREARKLIASLRQQNEVLVEQGGELGLGPRAVQIMLPKVLRWADEVEAQTTVDDDTMANSDALLKMQAEMEDRQATREFNEAYGRLSQSLPRVKRNGTIDLGKGKPIPFAKWEDCDAVIRPACAAEGFTLSFDSSPREGGGLIVTGHLMHRSGHTRTATIPLPLDSGPGRNSLQAVGSTLSYGKRYLAEMLLNIVRENQDDDGTKGGMKFITPAQIEELQRMMEETNTDEARFCQIFNVAHIGEMAEANLAAARNMLIMKKGKRA